LETGLEEKRAKDKEKESKTDLDKKEQKMSN
jgi:hypothetical protein